MTQIRYGGVDELESKGMRMRCGPGKKKKRKDRKWGREKVQPEKRLKISKWGRVMGRRGLTMIIIIITCRGSGEDQNGRDVRDEISGRVFIILTYGVHIYIK